MNEGIPNNTPEKNTLVANRFTACNSQMDAIPVLVFRFNGLIEQRNKDKTLGGTAPFGETLYNIEVRIISFMILLPSGILIAWKQPFALLPI